MKRFLSVVRLFGFAAVVLLAVIIGFYYLSAQAPVATPPAMAVGIREAEIDGDCITVQWVVTNCSDQVISFDENQIAQVECNGKEIIYPTEAIRLAPDEEVMFSISIPGAQENQTHHLTISAESNEGTKGTVKKTIYPPPIS